MSRKTYANRVFVSFRPRVLEPEETYEGCQFFTWRQNLILPNGVNDVRLYRCVGAAWTPAWKIALMLIFPSYRNQQSIALSQKKGI